MTSVKRIEGKIDEKTVDWTVGRIVEKIDESSVARTGRTIGAMIDETRSDRTSVGSCGDLIEPTMWQAIMARKGEIPLALPSWIVLTGRSG
ncbi:MAG: hypothetical protein NZM29_02635 [Nitrospira sp.]|nr:hypothetical protein [Nitrospira sp.]